jgi:predicted outer membrane repeat protein
MTLKPNRRRQYHPSFEALEHRCVPATITVTRLFDNHILPGVTLRDAIQAANTNMSVNGSTPGDPGADTIVFAPGLTGGVSLFSQVAITEPLTIQGLGAANTRIEGPGSGTSLFDITATAGDVTLDGLTLTGGSTSRDNQNNPPGRPGDFTNDGGAIQFLSHGTLTIRNSVLSGNSTMGMLAGGGAIFAYGGTVVIDHSTLSRNYSKHWRGGAIYSVNGPVTVTNSTLSGNVTAGNNGNGGAIFSANGPVTIANSTLVGNHTYGTDARGGAIFVRHDIPSLPTPTVTITNSTVSGNFTKGDRSSGGGVYARQDTSIEVTDSTIAGNVTKGMNTNGGGLFADTGMVTVRYSTIVGNTAHGNGGGIIVPYGMTTMDSSIIAGNTDSNSNGPSDLSGVASLSHSLVGSNRESGLTATGLVPDANGNLIGSDTTPIGPMLGPLQNNGGPTLTMALLPGSPAIDRGTNPLSLSSDQRGFPFARVVGSAADMGAFESQTSPNLVVTSAADRLDTTFDPANLTLRDAVSLANAIPGTDTVTFAPSLSGMPVQLSMGELSITDSVTIQGLGAAHTTIDAQGSSRIFDVSAAAGDVTLDGLTLTGGHVTATGEGGGAIHFAGSGKLTVQSCALLNNSSEGPGGAIDAPPAGPNMPSGPVDVIDSTLAGNSTLGPDAAGGAIFSSNVLRVIGSTISGNSTQGANANGGGLATGPGPAGLAQVVNSTLSGNFTQGDGANGGGLATGPYALAAVLNSTVTLNGTRGTHADGGGIFAVDSIALRSSIVAANYDQDDGSHPDLRPGSGTLDVTNSLIGANTGTSLGLGGPDANGNFIGGFNGLPLDPFLGPLADNGGPTKTHALLTGSVAINHGANPLNLTTDQRGVPFARVVGAQADIGALEVSNLHLLVISARDKLDAVLDPKNLSLREALALANANPGPDTITLDPSLSGVPIHLSLGQLLITDAVTIQGLSAAETVIDAQQQSRIFDATATAGDVTLEGLTLTGGRTTGDGELGGAIRFQSSGTLLVRDSSVSGNSTQALDAAGGGIAADAGAVMLTGSTVVGNLTQGLDAPGGGIWVALGAVTVSNSTIANNTTPADGGGIFAFSGAVTLNNSTVAGNSAQGEAARGGGIFANLGAVTLHSTIVADDRDNGGSPDLKPGKGPVSVTSSLIGSNQGTGLTATGLVPDANGDLIGSAGIPLDPLLGPLQNNGGPTPTLALLPGSPAIDRGANPLDLVTDQRGVDFSRQSGAGVDMGAFEFQVPPLPPPKRLPPAQPIGLVLTFQKMGRRRKLVALVQYTSGHTVVVISPFPGLTIRSAGPSSLRPRRAITAALVDLDGDGIFDAVLFTSSVAGKRRRVQRIVHL